MTKLLEILEDHDTITKGDWCRPLRIQRDGQSDYVPETNAYSGLPCNNMRWIKVEACVPYWVGKTISEFNEAFSRIRNCAEYEFVRGNLPKSHTMT
jgi:hypothetical protein